MSSRSVYKYRGICPDHGSVTSDGYYESVPTLCPVDGATAWSNTRIVETITQDKVFVTDEDPSFPKDFIKTKGFVFDIDAGLPGSTKVYTSMTPGLTIAAYGMATISNPDNVGDIISLHGPSAVLIGVITENMGPTMTTVSVSPTVLDNVIDESIIQLFSGGVYYPIGECIAVDTVNSTITTTQSPGTTITSGAQVRMTPVRISDLMLGSIDYVTGEQRIGYTQIKPNTQLNLVYQNNTGLAKKFCLALEYAVSGKR